MGDILTESLKKYGIKFVISAIVFAIAIWALAHWTAAPGNEISVLWGLVKYTKRLPETSVGREKDAEKKIPQSPDKGTLPGKHVGEQKEEEKIPFYPAIYHDISNEKAEGALSKLRTERKLRKLTAVESGKEIVTLPPGTYFYLLPSSITNTPKYNTLLSNVKKSSAIRYQFYQKYYELHNTHEGTLYIIGFVSEIQATDISTLSGSEKKVMFSAYPWGQMTSLVSLPIERIKESTTRSINISQDKDLRVLDIIVQ